MSRLLYSGFSRMRKSKAFWIVLVLMVLAELSALLNEYQYTMRSGTSVLLDTFLFHSLMFIGIPIAVFVSLFVGTEYSDGTIRNKLVAGHTRNNIYFANFLVSVVAGSLFFLAATATVLLLGTPLFGPMQLPLPVYLVMLGDGILICIVYGAVFNLIAMLVTNKTHTAILNILFAFGLLVVVYMLYAKLAQPEMTLYVEYTVDGMVTSEELIQNPRYVSGSARRICQFFMDFLPTGQSVQMPDITPWQQCMFAVYSVLSIAAANAAGVLCFHRKDIK